MLCHVPAKPRKQQHIRELICRESRREMEGGKEEWDWMGKHWVEGWGGGILWEGSQSNYKQWCSPGFFGGTKFTFRQSLPPSPSTFLLLLLKMPIPATLFPIFCSSWLTLTSCNRASLCTTPLPFPICLSFLDAWKSWRYSTVSPAKQQILSP